MRFLTWISTKPVFFLNLTGRVAYLDVFGSLQRWVPDRWPASPEGVLSVWSLGHHASSPVELGGGKDVMGWTPWAPSWMAKGTQKRPNRLYVPLRSTKCYCRYFFNHNNECKNIYLCLIRLLISQTTRLLFWYFLWLAVYICTLAQYLVSPDLDFNFNLKSIFHNNYIYPRWHIFVVNILKRDFF